ncbi:MAG: hypothetical protein KAI95_06065, partial [Bacteroidales bacterium]|nr:hypothetical protein [Bacteroidales bacterium]
DIEFRSNEFEGLDFTIDASPQHHSYSVFWTLTVNVINKKGKEVKGAEVRILDKSGEEVLTRRTGGNGSIKAELPEYTVDGDEITYLSPYTVNIGRKKEEVILSTDQVVTMKVK